MRKIEASFCKVDTFIRFFRIGDIANRADFANVRILPVGYRGRRDAEYKIY